MNNKNDISVKKNYIYNVCYQILNLLAPLITTPYISRVLGVKGVGEYSYTTSIVTYFITLAILGSTPYAQREISYVKDDKKKYSILFWELVFFRMITVLVSCVLYGGVIFSSNHERTLYLIQGLNIIAVAFDITWFFQGLEEFKKVVIRNTIVRILNIVLIFVAVKKEEDLWKYVLIITLLTVIGNISIWGYMNKYLVKISIHELNIKKHVKGIWQLFLPTIAYSIYRVLDKTMIGMATVTTIENGYYEQADKIIQMCTVLPTSLSTVMAPRIVSTIAQKNLNLLKEYMYRTFDFLWMITIPMTFGLIVIADMVIPWFFGLGYEKVSLLIKIFSPLIIVVAFSNALGVQFLIQARKQNIYTISISIGAIINLGINLILIPRFFSIGAAISSVIAESSILIVQLWYVCRKINVFKFKIIVRKLWICVGGSMVMAIILSVLKHFVAWTVWSTLGLVLIGIFIYFLYYYLLEIFANTNKR